MGGKRSFLWESRCEDCVPSLGNGDTLVQYAACPSVSSKGKPPAQFDSDYSGGEGASNHFFAGMWAFLYFLEY